MKAHMIITIVLLQSVPVLTFSQSKNTIAVDGLGFTLNGKPFHYTGVSFFNAIYNPAFNSSDDARRTWLNKFKSSGINVIRVWAQWDTERGLKMPHLIFYHLTQRGAMTFNGKLLQKRLLPAVTFSEARGRR